MRIDSGMARPTTGRTGKATNIYIDGVVIAEGRKVAKERYGISLSELVERLVRREIDLKRGLLKRTA